MQSNHGSSATSTKEFTESWLQALTLSVNHEAARRIRPWMTDLGLLTAAVGNPEQESAARRIWEYTERHGLSDLVLQNPSYQSTWKFEDDECFTFTQDSATLPRDFETWFAGLGINDFKRSMTAQITYDDWTNLIRREAVRKAKSLNVQAIQDSSMVKIPVSASWDKGSWTIQFENPSWLKIDQPGLFYCPRPASEQNLEMALLAIDWASKNLKVASKTQYRPSDLPWFGCVEEIRGLHVSVLMTNDCDFSPWVRRVWSSVWPVIYRERNRLRGACDLQFLRTELAECFTHAPLLTEWMFVFARLTMEIYIGKGLGISGDFRSE